MLRSVSRIPIRSFGQKMKPHMAISTSFGVRLNDSKRSYSQNATELLSKLPLIKKHIADHNIKLTLSEEWELDSLEQMNKTAMACSESFLTYGGLSSLAIGGLLITVGVATMSPVALFTGAGMGLLSVGMNVDADNFRKFKIEYNGKLIAFHKNLDKYVTKE